MNIVICDNDKQLLSIIDSSIRELLIKSPYSDFEYNIEAFNNSSQALKYCLSNDVNIAFLDIDMPGITGLMSPKLFIKITKVF